MSTSRDIAAERNPPRQNFFHAPTRGALESSGMLHVLYARAERCNNNPVLAAEMREEPRVKPAQRRKSQTPYFEGLNGAKFWSRGRKNKEMAIYNQGRRRMGNKVNYRKGREISNARNTIHHKRKLFKKHKN